LSPAFGPIADTVAIAQHLSRQPWFPLVRYGLPEFMGFLRREIEDIRNRRPIGLEEYRQMQFASRYPRVVGRRQYSHPGSNRPPPGTHGSFI